MRVLVVTQYFRPENFRINGVVESLQQAGCEVTVLTGQPNYPEGKLFAGYRAWGIGRDPQGSPGTVFRVPIIPRGRGSVYGLAANYLSFLICAALFGPWLLRRRRIDVIFVYGISPILQAIPAILLRRLKRARLVTWVQDLWPQSLEVTGFVHNQRVLGCVAMVVRWIYRHNDMLLVQSPAFAPIVRAMARNVSVRYYPNPGDVSVEQYQPAIAAPINLDPGFNVLFAGNLGTVQSLETILDAAELLRERADIRIVFVGGGSRAEWLMRECARRQLTNVKLFGKVPSESVPAVLAQASVLLVSLARSPTMSQTIPSKLQSYLAAGRPIIGSLDGEGARIIAEAGAGIACPAENAPALARTIIELHACSEVQRERMGRCGHEYYRANFDPRTLTQKLLDCFQEITRPKALQPDAVGVDR
jgi:glycosyltransferase involved in cell wall biosynthesis